MDEICPICGLLDCGGVVYPHMLAEYAAGRNRDHWRRIHDRAHDPAPTPEDMALRAYTARHGCGGCGG